MKHLTHCSWFIVVLQVYLLWPSPVAVAQPKLGAQAPALSVGAPLGLKRGSSAEVTLVGKNLAEPTGLWTSFPCKVSIPTDNKNGQDVGKLRVHLEVPADAPIGYHGIRLATTAGMSNMAIFCADDLDQVVQAGGNTSIKAAQPVKTPVVVAGRVDNLQAACFKITVSAGQRLSFDVLAHRLGSPIDAVVTVYSADGERQVAQATDTPGLQGDCRVTHTFAKAGDYVLEVRDVLNRGGVDYWFRLRIGDFPCATVPMPLAIQRGTKTLVHFAGPLVDGVAPVEVTAPADPLQNCVWVAPKFGNGLHGWPVALALSSHEEKVEQEPNDEPAKANRVAVPGGVTGRFDRYGDRDQFVFSTKKEQKLVLQAETLGLYSPALVYMTLHDAKGAEIAKTNPEAAAPADKRIEFTAAADGDYRVQVQHLNLVGGPSEVYHLTMTPKENDFDVSLALDRWDLAPGGALVLPLQVNRSGYTGPIAVSVISPQAGLFGSATIAENQKAGAIILQAKDDTPIGAYSVQLKAEATVGGQKITQLVSTAGPLGESLGKLPVPPLHLSSQVGVAVKPRAPFKLLVQAQYADVAPGLGLPVTVSVQREPGFDGPVEILPPAGLFGQAKPPAIKPIAKGQDKASFTLPIDPKTPAGPLYLQVTGKSKDKNKDVFASALPVTLMAGPPVALVVEPLALTIKQGDKAKLKVTATRKAGYDGPVEIELTQLPAKVVSTKVTLAKGQNSADLEISVAPDALVGEKKDVQAVGRATAAANRVNMSPAITLMISKK